MNAAMSARAALGFDERLDVLGFLDLIAAVPRARMCRHDLHSVEDAHRVERRDHDERAAHAVVRDRVVVEVEADVRRLADLDLDALVGREWIVRQREQTRRSSSNASRTVWRAVLGPASLGGDARGPVLGLALRSSRSVKVRAAKKLSRM